MLTAVVLTKNEEKNIERCINSLGFCNEIIVVDDESTDDTVKITKNLGAKILSHKMVNYGDQRNWVLDQIRSTWVLFVDADEIVSKELAGDIQKALIKNQANGYLIHRVDHLWNHTFKYGDVGNVWLLRLARRGAGLWKGAVHETWKIDGQVSKLKGDLNHYPHPTVVEFLKHINNYSTLKAAEFHESGRKTNILEIIFAPIWRFKCLYIFKLGFLDGTAGFVHAMMMSFYVFLTAGKLFMYDRHR